MEFLYEKINTYLHQLDWDYILTYFVICYLFSKDEALTIWWSAKRFSNVTLCKIRSYLLAVPKEARMFCIGVVYACAIYYVREYDKTHFKKLFQSFIFALAFYGVFINKVLSIIENMANGKSIKKPDNNNDIEHHP